MAVPLPFDPVTGARTMACWTAEATARPWCGGDAPECKAWMGSKALRHRINGMACEGCARLPEGER